MREIKYINVSGLGHSGKSSITDLLKEFENVLVIDTLFEFDLLRIPGGLSDLKYNLYDNWSPIRSDTSIKRFRKVCKRLSNSSSLNFYDKISSYGTNYEKIFNNQFMVESEIYLNKLITKKLIRKYWPYRLIEKSSLYLFAFKIFRKIKLDFFFFKRYYEYLIVDNKNFIEHTRTYINNLFKSMAINYDFIVLNNTIEPFENNNDSIFFSNIFSLVVIRDPRDIYASINFNEKTYTPEHEKRILANEIKSDFLNAKCVNDFISIQKNLYDNFSAKGNENTMIIKFEDFVLKYNKTLDEICKNLGLRKNLHKQKKKFFNPENSKNNIGIWKKYANTYEIKLIEKELKEYCYQK